MKRKNKLLIISAILLCLMLVAGCSKTPAGSNVGVSRQPMMSETALSSLASLRDIMKEDNSALGIAFLGYVDGNTSIKDYIDASIKNGPYAEMYPFLTEIPVSSQVSFKGQELYVLVPKNETYSITIYEDDIITNGNYRCDDKKLIYAGAAGEIVLLCCNESELHTNVCISVSGKNEDFRFHPLLSLNDGRIDMETGYTDFTLQDYGVSLGYLYDMTGEWWSEPQKDSDENPVYYRVKLDYHPDFETNSFELSAGDSVYENWYGIYWLTDSETNEYSYTMYAQEKERSGKFIITKDDNRLTIRESGGDRLFFLTDTSNLNFRFCPYPDLSGYDDSVQIAFETLRYKDEIQYYCGHSGMELIYTDEHQDINDEHCMIFALGTNHDDQFVREFFYAASDEGNMYSYDVINDIWLVFGEG